MWKRTLLLLSILVLTLSACAAKPPNFQEVPAPEPGIAQSKGVGGSDQSFVESMPAALPSADIVNAPSQPDVQRLVIKNASMEIVVENPPSVMDAITQMAESMNGFVVTSNVYQSYLENGAEVPHASITIRVPAEQFNTAIEQIKAGAGRVLSENITGEDVTQQYTDLASRLRNLESAETQLQAIMDQAYKTDDVLQVYNQLTQVREQIEVLKGQMQYFEQSAAFSAISVDITADAAVQPLTIGGWQPVGVAKDAVQSLINTLQSLANILIWLVLYLLPVALILFLPVRWIWHGLRRWRLGRKKKNAAPSAE